MNQLYPACFFLALVSAPASASSAAEASLAPIVVTAPRVEDDYRATDARVGPIARPLLKTPASVGVVTRAVMDDQSARGVADVVGNDASIGENYSPVGYYESLSVRGFALDNATAFKRDGLTIANESSMPLENKERVEILKGAAGFEAGLAAPGGIVNYAVKRPTAIPTRRLEFELRERGTRYAHADVGGRVGGGRLGYRLNAAREDYRPYVKEATGSRDFAGVFLDWRAGDDARLEFDADWQRKSQLSVPGNQSLGGTAVPSGADPEKMLNNQPWSAPVAITATNVGGRFLYRSKADRRLDVSFARNRLVSDDAAAFPFGCSSGPVYLTTFCGNGDYDLYDYRSLGETRTATQAQAVLSGDFETGPVRHEASAGVSNFRRTVDLGAAVYEFVGTDNIYNPRPLVFAPSPKAPGAVHRVQNYAESALLVRDAISFSERWTLHAGLRLSAVEDERFGLRDGVFVSRYARTVPAPQFALIFAPRPEFMTYAAYSEGQELGGTAPAAAANAGRIHDPKISRQFEVGVKRDVSERLSLTSAAFYVRRPLEFTDPNNVFIQRGVAAHAGAELSAAGSPAHGLRMIAGATAIRARQSGTGIAAFDGKTPVNVPWLRARASTDYSFTRVPGIALNGAWAYVASKYAARDGSLSVPGYQRVDLGVRYSLRAGRGRLTWRLRVENLLDARYWRDSGEAFGDGYLHLGAPRIFKLSAQLDI